MPALYPPTQASVIAAMNQHNGTIHELFTQVSDIVFVREDVAFDDSGSCRILVEWFIEFFF
jgi:hypothetical protein